MSISDFSSFNSKKYKYNLYTVNHFLFARTLFSSNYTRQCARENLILAFNSISKDCIEQ